MDRRYRPETPEERAERKSFAAPWNADRVFTRRPFQKRYVVTVDEQVHNVATAAEALRIAQLHANTGSAVFVRDRSRRRGYLTEAELEIIAKEEADAQGT